jgi:two-component sensor histidine kinase
MRSRLLRAYNRAAELEPWRAYLFAAVCVVCATAVRLGIGVFHPTAPPYATFFAAILLCSIISGPGPGAFALVLSAFAVWALILPPEWSFSLAPGQTMNLMVLVAVGALVLLAGATMQALLRGYREALAAAEAAEERRADLTRELEHRVRNILTTVRGLARQSERSSETLDEFSTTFDTRLRALEATHRLLTEQQRDSVRLKDVLQAEMAPYEVTVEGTGNFSLCGPTVEMPPQMVTPVGLIIHELIMNATKHGALVEEKGQVAVEWSADQQPGSLQIVLKWREYGGPTVAPPSRIGFGTRLLNRLVQRELQGTLRSRYMPVGFECDLIFAVPFGPDRLEATISDSRSNEAMFGRAPASDEAPSIA